MSGRTKMFGLLVLAVFGALGTVWGEKLTENKPDAAMFTDEQLQEIKSNEETFQFQTQVTRLMNILVNSLYTNKEVFLRELISNANDALDKVRFLGLTNASALEPKLELEIKVKAHPEDGTLRIRDTGIGMSKAELIKNLGTIAQSGTTEFLKKMESGDATSLIGQFGVGFYSAFLAADRVTVVSKSNADPDQHIWESDASGSFTITKDPRGNTLGRGTEIVLHLKEDAKATYLDQKELTTVIQRYSQFINFPIKLWGAEERDARMEEEEEEVTEEEEGGGENAASSSEENDEDEEIKVDGDAETAKEKKEKAKEEKQKREREEEEREEKGEDMEEDEDEKDEEPIKYPKKVTEWDWILMNNIKPIWTRAPREISEEEYNDFYKALTRDTEDPMAYKHFSAEGDATFKALMYIPKHAPQEMWEYNASKPGLRLFVRHVFVTNGLYTIVPPWLNFVKGVVDSDDIPINVGREQVQETKVIDGIKAKVVRKAIQMIQEIFKRDEGHNGTYRDFYNEYATNMKMGANEDKHNSERLMKMLLFYTSHGSDGKELKMTTFDEYLERLKKYEEARTTSGKPQKDIIFIAGDSLRSIQDSPLVEKMLKQGREILYMVDPMDEVLINNVKTYNGHKITNIAIEGARLDFLEDDDEKRRNEDDPDIKDRQDLFNWFRRLLSETVRKVAVSKMLTDTPMAVIASTYAVSSNMERIRKYQTYTRTNVAPDNSPPILSQHVLEVNMKHPIIRALNRKIKAGTNTPDDDKLIYLLYKAAVIEGGFNLKDPFRFASRVYDVVGAQLGVAADELKGKHLRADRPEKKKKDDDDFQKSRRLDEDVDDEDIYDDDDVEIPDRKPAETKKTSEKQQKPKVKVVKEEEEEDDEAEFVKDEL